MPSDLGYADGSYALPPLVVTEHTIPAEQSDVFASGFLFAQEAGSLTERRAARRASMSQRIAECVAIVNADRQPWVVWAELNAESEALAEAIDGSIEITGSMKTQEKEDALRKFLRGDARVLVTKARIAGWGINMQSCARVAFVGVTDSFESYYQAVRRCWRFGQTREVHMHLFASEQEGSVMKNLVRKEQDAMAMSEALAKETAAIVAEQVRGMNRETNAYEPRVVMRVPEWVGQEVA
jgi:superfamily II DNA or RNA helicase